MELESHDSFLRRVNKGRCARRGVVEPDAFLDSHPSLSFTLQAVLLQSESGLREYQVAKRLPSGDLPAICKLTFSDFIELVKPPLPPRFEPDNEDALYGQFHCATDRPDGTQREQMARDATQHGILLEFRRK